MKKTELIESIINTFTCIDIRNANELSLTDASKILEEIRENEHCYLDRNLWLPNEVTPELYMEAYNCYLRKCRHDITARRLAEFIQLRELVDMFHEFDGEFVSYKSKIVYPTSFLTMDMEFPFTSIDLCMLELITLGQNSPDFDPEKEYCWYDEKNHQLHSTNTPFADGLLDAMAFAEWLLENPEQKQYVIDCCMDNTDIDYIFRYEVEKK